MRAILALLLMIGFYVLAFAISATLLFVVYLQIAGGFLNAYLLIICVFGAAVILWSIIPRFNKFIPPGPRLEPDKHPGLFAELASMAKSVGQEMPSEVYILADVNAMVFQRGGIMGLGSHRVMGIGLPLLKILTISQLRAVLAHELGHYYRGDTKLGPWVYKTRATIIRTLWGLRGHSILQLPFRGYGIMYLRITQAVSRQQEYSADALAAHVAGSRNAISALRAIHGAAPAWEAYWRGEFVPVLNAGFITPLADGFGKFMQAKSVSEEVSRIVEKGTSESRTNPYDSHPSLKDRIAALQSLPPGVEVGDEFLAISLVENVPQIEVELLNMISERNHIPKPTPVKWDDLITRFYVPNWQTVISRQKSALAGVIPESLPKIAKNLKSFENKLTGVDGLTDQQRVNLLNHIIGAALTLALLRQQWTIQTAPGEDISLNQEGKTLHSFKIFPNLSAGLLSGEQWSAICKNTGIAGMDLSKVGEHQG